MDEDRGPDRRGAPAPVHDVPAGVELIRRGVALICGGAGWALSDGEVRDAVTAAAAARSSLDAGWLALLPRPGPAGRHGRCGDRPGR